MAIVIYDSDEEMAVSEASPLSSEQAAAYNAITSRVSPVYFLAAPGGSGKSHLVKHLLKNHSEGEVMITATTNQAASNFSEHRACTIHRAFCLMDADSKWIEGICYDNKKRFQATCNERLEPWFSLRGKLKYVVIDEISMMSAELFDRFMARFIMCCIAFWKRTDPRDYFPEVRTALREYHAKASASSGSRQTTYSSNMNKYDSKPAEDKYFLNGSFWMPLLRNFAQMGSAWKNSFPTIVLVGDPLQLEPVSRPTAPAQCCWESELWALFAPHVLSLEQNQRAKDDERFQDFLSSMRVGGLDPGKFSELIKVNALDKVLDRAKVSPKDAPVMLVGQNDLASHINGVLYGIVSQKRNFKLANQLACDFSPLGPPQEKYMLQAYASDLADALPNSVDLCVGASVILIHNICVNSGIVKGARGIVQAILTFQTTDYSGASLSNYVFNFGGGAKVADLVDLMNYAAENRASSKNADLHCRVNVHDADGSSSGWSSFLSICSEHWEEKPGDRVSDLFAPCAVAPKSPHRGLDNCTCVLVKFEHLDIPVLVYPQKFSCYEFKYNPVKKVPEAKEVACRVQWPFYLGYAITVHRAQGMTLNNVHVQNEGNGQCFGNHSLYVAASRARKFENISFAKVPHPADVQVNTRTLQRFYGNK